MVSRHVSWFCVDFKVISSSVAEHSYIQPLHLGGKSQAYINKSTPCYTLVLIFFNMWDKYEALECLLTDEYYKYKMDKWRVGCVFFEIVSLFPLFPIEPHYCPLAINVSSNWN